MSIDRRSLLKSGAALTVASLLASTSELTNAAPGRSIDLPWAGVLVPEKMPRAVSKNAMHRPWTKLRGGINREKIDHLIISATTRAIDQYLLSWLNLSLISKTL